MAVAGWSGHAILDIGRDVKTNNVGIYRIFIAGNHQRHGLFSRFLQYLADQGESFFIAGLGTTILDHWLSRHRVNGKPFISQGGDFTYYQEVVKPVNP